MKIKHLDEDKHLIPDEYNLTSKDICNELLRLDITNYSYTDYDDSKV